VAFGWLLGAVVVVRTVYAAVFPLDLAPDESYYWDWGRRLDIGYYSKPPMVGWLMALAGWIGSDSPFLLKLFPALLTALGLACAFQLGRDMFGARAGFWATVLLLSTPANAVLSTFFTIDAPLFCFWSASLWLAWRWWTTQEVRWAVLLTVSMGCGYLTKQIHLVFPVLLLVFTGVARERGTARLGTLATMIAVSLAFLTPPLIWNWQHDWVTFRHTADELEQVRPSLRRALRFLGEFLGGQAALGGGVTWVAMIAAAAGTAVSWPKADLRHRFLLLFSLPGLLCFAALSLFQRVEQNWPLVFYSAAGVLLGGVALARVEERWRLRVWVRVGVAVGAVLAVAIMAVPFVIPATHMAGSRSDPTARVRGWGALAEAIHRMRVRLPRPGETFILAPEDRYVASALAYYLPDQPRTWCWENPERPDSQYGIWGRPYELPGWDALVIEHDAAAPRLQEIRRNFVHWEPLGEIRVPLGPGRARARRYEVFLGRDFRPAGEPAESSAEPGRGGSAE
jgi:4-amino-4-deoxy-L-arabinose transferase-like glycosyltransferase